MTNGWYSGLEKSALTPPGWVFGPVWSVLYTMIAISFVAFLLTRQKKHPVFTVSLFVVHMAANFAWPYLFFRMHSVMLSFVDIVFLVISLGVLIRFLHMTSRLSAWLLLPYGLWLAFATYLNLCILLLN